MSEARPKFSPEIAKIAAAEIVSDLIKGGHLTEDQRDDSVADLAKYGRQHADGYEIAKALDSGAYWDCDFQIAEILDGFGFSVSRAIDQAEKEWAERCNVQPPLPIGARVKLHRGETGEITGVYEHGAAKYLVKIDGNDQAAAPTNSRRVVNFEDAVLEAEPVR